MNLTTSQKSDTIGIWMINTVQLMEVQKIWVRLGLFFFSFSSIICQIICGFGPDPSYALWLLIDLCCKEETIRSLSFCMYFPMFLFLDYNLFDKLSHEVKRDFVHLVLCYLFGLDVPEQRIYFLSIYILTYIFIHVSFQCAHSQVRKLASLL